MNGQKPKLTEQQAREVQDWWVQMQALPTSCEMQRRYGIDRSTLLRYARGEIKHYRKRAARHTAVTVPAILCMEETVL